MINKSLSAELLDGPHGLAYFVEKERYPHEIYFTRESFVRNYGEQLANILDSGKKYYPPKFPGQLTLDFIETNESR